MGCLARAGDLEPLAFGKRPRARWANSSRRHRRITARLSDCPGGWGGPVTTESGLRRILVVDDRAMVREFMEEVLGRAGHEVRSAESAERALEALRDETFQVMFLDLELPATNGLELCREIRKGHPVALLHAMSDYPPVFGVAECRAAGFDDYFVKPVQTDEILKAAQDAFEKSDRWNLECAGAQGVGREAQGERRRAEGAALT